MWNQQTGAAIRRLFAGPHETASAADRLIADTRPAAVQISDFPDHILPLLPSRIADADAAAMQDSEDASIAAPASAAISVDDIILHSMEFIRHLANRRGARVSVAIARRLPTVTCDLAATRCLIANLLIRAIKLCDPNRFSVFVCAYVGNAQDTVEVCVSHNRQAPATGEVESDREVVEADACPILPLDDLPEAAEFGQLRVVHDSDTSQTYCLSLPVHPSEQV